jgi:hypothetical protein
MLKYTWLIGCLLIVTTAFTQTPTDGFFMPKGEICIAATYNNDSWNQYWEGTLKRDNANIGTITTQQVQAMAAYGLNKYINLIAILPNYVVTHVSAGVLAGHRGFQDAALWLKIRPYQSQGSVGRLETFVAAGWSTPVSNYYPDYMPLSIGLGAQTLQLRANGHFFLKNGLFVGLQGGYQRRSNIELERDFYYADGLTYYTGEVEMPNAADGSVTLGYLKGPLRVELGGQVFRTLGGGDIRRNEMPFPSYRMDMQRLTTMVQYRPKRLSGFGLMLQIGNTLSGRNVGQSFNWGGGLLYQFPVQKREQQG